MWSAAAGRRFHRRIACTQTRRPDITLSPSTVYGRSTGAPHFSKLDPFTPGPSYRPSIQTTKSVKLFSLWPVYTSETTMPPDQTNLLLGTLDMLILKSLALTELHGLGISRRISQITKGTFDVKP